MQSFQDKFSDAVVAFQTAWIEYMQYCYQVKSGEEVNMVAQKHLNHTLTMIKVTHCFHPIRWEWSSIYEEVDLKFHNGSLLLIGLKIEYPWIIHFSLILYSN